jgi:hypothetical protein
MFNLDIDPLDLAEADPAFTRSALSGARGQQSTTAVARQGAAPQAQTPAAPEIAPMAQTTREFVRGDELPSYLFRDNMEQETPEPSAPYEPAILRGRVGSVIEQGIGNFVRGVTNPEEYMSTERRAQLQRQRQQADNYTPMFDWVDPQGAIERFSAGGSDLTENLQSALSAIDLNDDQALNDILTRFIEMGMSPEELDPMLRSILTQLMNGQ